MTDTPDTPEHPDWTPEEVAAAYEKAARALEEQDKTNFPLTLDEETLRQIARDERLAQAMEEAKSRGEQHVPVDIAIGKPEETRTMQVGGPGTTLPPRYQAQGEPGRINIVPRPNNEERVRMLSDPNNIIPAPDHICPRCRGDVPTSERKGEYPGAISRTDNRTEVCSHCGSEEAFEQMAGRLTPQNGWPVAPHAQGEFRPENFRDAWEDVRASNRRARTPIPSPRELPDLRLHLLEKWIPGGVFERATLQKSLGHAIDVGKGQLVADVDWEVEWEREALRNASLWWVRDEMCDITSAAAKSMPPDVRGEEVILPAKQPYGLAVLGTPFQGIDAINPDAVVQVDALLWGTSEVSGTKCISLAAYRYFDLEGGLGPQELQEAINMGAFMDAKNEYLGVSGQGGPSFRVRGGSWVFLGRTDWPLEDALESFEAESRGHPPSHHIYTDQRKASMIEDRRLFTAFCVLVNHKLTQTEMVWAERQTVRRQERAGVVKAKEVSHVRLIRLREVRKHQRGEGDGDEKKHIEYSHRWLVNGHMAWRRCGPKGSQRRLTFITPHIKGPKDKPLVLKEDVRVWSR